MTNRSFSNVFAKFQDPSIQFIETFAVGQVEDDQSAEWVIIEGLIKRPKSLLSGCIPNLDDHMLFVDINKFFGILQSDGSGGNKWKFILDIPGDDVCLSHPALAYLIGWLPINTSLMYLAMYSCSGNYYEFMATIDNISKTILKQQQLPAPTTYHKKDNRSGLGQNHRLILMEGGI